MPHKQKVGKKWIGTWFGQIKQHGHRYRKVFPTKDAAKTWEVAMKRDTNGEALQSKEQRRTPTICLLEWGIQYLTPRREIQPQDLQ